VTGFPARSGVPEVRPHTNAQWNAVYEGAKCAVAIPAINRVLQRSYTCVYIDEYQDCGVEQHKLVLAIAEHLPCRIVGDPLQGIFGFGGQQIVDWPSDVRQNFDTIGELNQPWRWDKANRDLGAWTIQIRESLENGKPIDLRTGPITWKPKSHDAQLATCRAALRNRKAKIIAIHTVAAQCHSWARRLPGFVSDEEMESKDLFTTARKFDHLAGPSLVTAVLKFATMCHTNVKQEIGAATTAFTEGRIPRIQKNTKHPETIKALLALASGDGRQGLHVALERINQISSCRIFRTEVWREMRSAAKFFEGGEAESLEDAAWQMRQRTRHRGKKLPRAVVSRTLLIKGMEFDHGIILDADKLSKREDFYVSATRAAHTLTIFSDNPVISFGHE
jgi:DNA helicase-2/ATP-dependent DNA helicase PcrA